MPERIITVLSIEDDPQTSKAYELTLSSRFHSYEAAHTLADGLERLRHGGIGCVMVDLRLPDAVGVEAVEKIQAEFPEVPIVVLTGASTEWDNATLAGAQAVLVKPVTADTIVTQIHHAVVRHVVRRKYERPTKAIADALGIVEDQLEKAK